MFTIKYRLTKSCLVIYDSYVISKWDFCEILEHIRFVEGDINRTNLSLILEWSVHNFLYKIGYKRDRTKDTDFELPLTDIKQIIGYWIFGWFCWLLIH